MASYNWLRATLFQYTQKIEEDTIEYFEYQMNQLEDKLTELNREIKYFNNSIGSSKLDKPSEQEIQKIEELNKQIEQIKEKIEKIKQQKKDKQDFINKNLTEKDKNRTPEQAKKDFISAANWSWNTEDVLKLMEEGLIPTDLVKEILKDASWANNIWCLFNKKVSLKHLIASKNIQILSYYNSCVALNPARQPDENKRRIKNLFEQTGLNLQKDNARLRIHIHGTGGYVNDFDNTSDLDVKLTLSNIPSGLVATNSGIKERVNIGKDIVSAVIKEFDDRRQNKEQNQEAHENEDMITKKNKIMISSASFGNLFAALLANELTNKQKLSIDILEMYKFPYSCGIFQSIDDIADALKNDNCAKNIKEIWIPEVSDEIIHYKSLSQKLKQSLENFVSKSGRKFNVKNMHFFERSRESLQEFYTGEWKDDKQNGKGKAIAIVYDDIITQEGIFKNNQFQEGTTIQIQKDPSDLLMHVKKIVSSNNKTYESELEFCTSNDIIWPPQENQNEQNPFTKDEIEKYRQMYEKFLEERGIRINKKISEHLLEEEQQEQPSKEEQQDIENTKKPICNEEIKQNNNKSINQGDSKINLKNVNHDNAIGLK